MQAKRILLRCLLCAAVTVSLAAQDFRRDATVEEGERETAPRFHANNSASTSASDVSNIQVESWTKPKQGWLYVLDPKPEAGGPAGRVWLIDPETGKVMGNIRTGDNADFALTPDGSRLYVASITEGDSSELAVIDTVQGVVLKRGEI